MIVAIEGIDASGKETQANMLKNWAAGRRDLFDDVSSQDFPDYTTLTGHSIGGLLKGKWSIVADALSSKEGIKALVLQCMMVTNRLEWGSKLRKFETSDRRLLVCDRYHASAQVYGASDGLSPSWLRDIHELLPEPALWVLVDIPVDESFRRRPEREDYYERDRGKLEDVRERYLTLFEDRRREGHDNWFIVNGIGNLEDVQERIKRLVIKKLQS